MSIQMLQIWHRSKYRFEVPTDSMPWSCVSVDLISLFQKRLPKSATNSQCKGDVISPRLHDYYTCAVATIWWKYNGFCLEASPVPEYQDTIFLLEMWLMSEYFDSLVGYPLIPYFSAKPRSTVQSTAPRAPIYNEPKYTCRYWKCLHAVCHMFLARL